jgi:glyoxylase-like metal-dependent hydrolase (beta-lactamase superfamily II)
MMLTHAHGDHAGGVGPFPEVYLRHQERMPRDT